MNAPTIYTACTEALRQGGEPALVDCLLQHVPPHAFFAVEFGASGKGPTYHLRSRPEWKLLLMDAAPGPGIIQAEINAENIDAIFAENQVPSHFDLLSIDIDGNDYWVWKALLENRHYFPQIVFIEYNCFFPPGCAVSVPYDLQRQYQQSRYYGASAEAMFRLGRRHGYRLVCVEGFMNMVFVRHDLLPDADEAPTLRDLLAYPLDIEQIARDQGFNWRPSWINAPAPDLTQEVWIHVENSPEEVLCSNH